MHSKRASPQHAKVSWRARNASHVSGGGASGGSVGDGDVGGGNVGGGNVGGGSVGDGSAGGGRVHVRQRAPKT